MSSREIVTFERHPILDSVIPKINVCLILLGTCKRNVANIKQFIVHYCKYVYVYESIMLI